MGTTTTLAGQRITVAATAKSLSMRIDAIDMLKAAVMVDIEAATEAARLAFYDADGVGSVREELLWEQADELVTQLHAEMAELADQANELLLAWVDAL